MFASIKQILIAFFILSIALFGFSSALAYHTAATQTMSNSPISYKTENLQEVSIDQMITTFNPKISAIEKETIVTTIIEESGQTNFDPLLIASVIAAESSFRPTAVSPCEARGLMQITDCVSQIMKISNPFDIKQNIYAGARYLKDLSQQFGEFELILAAYNAGPTRVARLGQVPRITETINYIQRVSEFYQNIRGQLLATANIIISQPIFNPIGVSLDQSHTHSQTQFIGDNLPPHNSVCLLSVENNCCESKRLTKFLVNV